MKFKFFPNHQKPFWLGLSQVIFPISSVTFVALFFAEYLEPGFVTNWFNPVWLLILSLFSGILATTKKYD